MRERLKILHITPGGIEIPPKGWGAVEKIIWNYKIQFEKMGHQFDIGVPWDIKEDYDIIHVHMANQSIGLNENKYKYIFSLHDHHVYIRGKGSKLYEQNLEAMKKSIISLTHAEYLINFFDSTDKLFFLEHGVDTNLYVDKNIKKEQHKLLCVASNGLIGDKTNDRKGFRLSIESAKELNLPITIVGPYSNKKFFENNEDLLKYDKLNIIYNPTESELINIYNDHTIFLHLSNLEAGHPNLTILESLSCGLLPIVGTYLGKSKLNGLIKTKLDKTDVIQKISYVVENYDILKNSIKDTIKNFDWEVVSKKLEQIYYNVKDIKLIFTNDLMKEKIIESYENTKIEYKSPIIPPTKFLVDFQSGAKVSIHSISGDDTKYKIDFIDSDKNNLVYTSIISSSHWTQTIRKWYTNWIISITNLNNGKQDYVIFNPKNKEYFIELETDNMTHLNAWLETVDNFRVKNDSLINCLIRSNNLDKQIIEKYKNIKFVDNNYDSNRVYAKYKIGYSDDININPNGNTGENIAKDILQMF